MKKILDLIAKKWSLLAILSIHQGENGRTFNELKRELEGITPKMLSQRLSELTNAGLLKKQDKEGRTRYTLTKSAQELIPTIYTLRDWGKKHLSLKNTCGGEDCRHFPKGAEKIKLNYR